MKRLLSLILAVSLLFSIALPAAAEDTGDDSGLISGDAEGDGTDNSGSNADNSDISTTSSTADSVLSIDHLSSWNVTEGTSNSGRFFLNGYTLDSVATIRVTDSNGSPSNGITLVPIENSDVLNNYTFYWNVAGSYKIYAELNGTTYGPVTVTISSTTFTDNVPSQNGLYFYHDNQYDSTLTLGVGSTFNTCIVYVNNGVATALTRGLTASNGLTLTHNSYCTYQLSPTSAGTHTITHDTYGTLTVSGRQNGSDGSSNGLDLSNPPFENGLAFCWEENGSTMWITSPNFSGQFGATLVVVKNSQASIVTDRSKLTIDPSEGLTLTDNGNGNYKLTGTKKGTYTLTYTDDDESTYSLTATYDDGSVDLEQIPKDTPGLYTIINDNYAMLANNIGFSMPGQCIGPLLVVKNNGEAIQLTDYALLGRTELPNLTLSPSSGLELSLVGNALWRAIPSAGDVYTLTYTDTDGAQYSLTYNVDNVGQLYAKLDGTNEWLNTLTVTEDEPTVVTFAWKNAAGQFIETIGTVGGSNDQVTITRDMNTKKSTVLVDNPGVNANAVYNYDDNNIYIMQIISREAYRLAIREAGTSTAVYDFTGVVGKKIPVEFFFARPSDGLTNNSPDYTELNLSEGLALEKDETDGTLYLTIETEGEHTIQYTCTVYEKETTFTIPVTGIPVNSDQNFFALRGASSSPVYTTSLIAGGSQDLRFCYGSLGDYTVLKLEDLMVDGVSLAEGATALAGRSVTLTQNGEYIQLRYTGTGQTLIQYQTGDVVHNYVVKCFTTLDEEYMADYSDQSTHASVNLDYNGQTVTVGTAYRTSEKMVMWSGNSFNETADSDFDIWEELVIGAMYAGANNSVTEPVDSTFYNRISNMKLSFLSFTNTTDPSAGYNLTLDAPTTVSWQGRTLQMQAFRGTQGQHFEAELLVNFDVEINGVTHRFYRTGEVSYRALPSNEVTVDITDADVLNTLLSNSYTLINYLEDNVEGFVYQGGSLTLTLPAVTYDKLIVSQLILPGSTDVLSTFTIRGSTDGQGNRTTLHGLYSKGFLTGVEQIDFTADRNVTMEFGGEAFTCGLFVNNTRTNFQPTFDLDTLMKYHPEFQGLTRGQSEAKFATYNPSVPTNGNSYNISYVDTCTFTGFEYAMRTDAGGFVQGSTNCTIRHCKYGVYINARGAATLATTSRANTIWRNNTFIENWVPVRIVDLPADLSPYYIRFIDNCFWRNNTEFWVSTSSDLGRYYFYRNYYSGHWDDGYRNDYWNFGTNDALPHTLMTLTDDGTEGARAANIAADAVLVTNPCRSTPDSTENLWIYDTDDQQNTMIFQSDADSMLVDPDAITALGDTLNIPILNDQQETVGTWTVYEGGDAQ